jgi:1,4-dihydroxy-2-naphthoate octaprenyltransferase
MSKSSLINWVAAIRLRTLFLSFACIATGLTVAAQTNYTINSNVAIFTFLTALCLQILSNLANDYGDSIHGADSANRKGPKRTVQSGAITAKQMKNAIKLLVILSLISGILLLYFATATIGLTAVIILFTIGILAIAAAIYYTNGKKPYGYTGLGDVSVFIFFGLVAVCGTSYLQTASWQTNTLLPAMCMGFLSTGVLNINNMRDIISDANAGKRSIPVKIGLNNAKIYHVILISAALISITTYAIITASKLWFLATFPLFIMQLVQLVKVKSPEGFDPFLKQLSLTTFLLAILFMAGIVYV